MPIARQVLKALLVSLVLALSAYIVAKLDLFGLESASDKLADQVYQRITAADYGPDRRGQQAISVVYLDESSMRAMRSFGWNRFPPTYDQQWTMLDDVMNSGGAPPAAVYVDFVYTGEGGPDPGVDEFVSGVAAATHASQWSTRPGCLSDPLVKIACIITAGGTPMIFARPSPVDEPDLTAVQQRLNAVAVLATALVGEDAYPLVVRYSLSPAAEAEAGVSAFDVSPAMAMYAAWCLRQADGCHLPVIARLKARANAALAGRTAAESAAAYKGFTDPLDVVWGSRPDPDYLTMTRNVTGRAAPCRGRAGGWAARLIEQLATLRGPGAGARQECPYALTLGYDRMVVGLGLQRSDLQRLLAGKMVMVGGQFRTSNDWVESPVHGQAPGVQYHAMALDNLIEDGANYRRLSGDLLDSDLLKSLLVAAMAFCGVMGVMTRNTLLDREKAKGAAARLQARTYAPLYLLIFSLSLSMVAAATWLGVVYAHRSPINWIGITAVAVGFLFYATRETLPADIVGSIEHLPWVKKGLEGARAAGRVLKFEEDRLWRHKPPEAKTHHSNTEGASDDVES